MAQISNREGRFGNGMRRLVHATSLVISHQRAQQHTKSNYTFVIYLQRLYGILFRSSMCWNCYRKGNNGYLNCSCIPSRILYRIKPTEARIAICWYVCRHWKWYRFPALLYTQISMFNSLKLYENFLFQLLERMIWVWTMSSSYIIYKKRVTKMKCIARVASSEPPLCYFSGSIFTNVTCPAPSSRIIRRTHWTCTVESFIWTGSTLLTTV